MTRGGRHSGGETQNEREDLGNGRGGNANRGVVGGKKKKKEERINESLREQRALTATIKAGRALSGTDGEMGVENDE